MTMLPPNTSSSTSSPPINESPSENGYTNVTETAYSKHNNENEIQRRRAFTAKQNLRRQVFREITSYHQFPLQEMAMKDLDANLKDYYCAADKKCRQLRSETVLKTANAALKNIDTESVLNQRSSAGGNENAKKAFLDEFLREKSLPLLSVGESAFVDTRKCQSNIADLDAKSRASPNAKKGQHDGIIKIDSVNLVEKENVPANQTDNIAGNSTTKKTQNVIDERLQQEEGSFSSKAIDSKPDLHCSNYNDLFLPALWSMEPRIFAMETAMKGKRRYVSCHLGRFMDHYWRECNPHNRHYYELIHEDWPCRLYFDLEFNKAANPHLSASVTEDLLTQLFSEIQLQFKTVHNICISRSDVVDLDSSTSKKFSRHWILHLPNGELFRDAREAGVFVKELVIRLEDERDSGLLQRKGHELLANNLSVNAENCNNEDKKLTRFIDLGVYTRNRIFRLLGSTKFGKPPDAALRIASANEFPFPDDFDNSKFYLPEMNKHEVDSKTNEASVDEKHNGSSKNDFHKFCKSMNWEAHANAMALTFVVPANARKIEHPILTNPVSMSRENQSLRLTRTKSYDKDTCTKPPRPTSCYGKSPLPKLEEFIVSNLGNRGGVQGSIGTWSLAPPVPIPRSISFTMKNNRYCENISRAHKSNNIIWVVHLIDRVCWQNCHDPECRASGFKGVSHELPPDVNTEIDDFLLDYELSTLIESSIFKGATKVGTEWKDEEEIDEFSDASLEEAMSLLDISKVTQQHGAGENKRGLCSGKVEGGSPSLLDSRVKENSDNSVRQHNSECSQMDNKELLELISTLPEIFS